MVTPDLGPAEVAGASRAAKTSGLMVTSLPAWPTPIALGADIELRRWKLGDEDALSAAVVANLEHLRPWMAWIADEPVPEPYRRRILEEWVATEATDRHYGFFDGDTAIGSIGAMSRIGPGALEIGYWIDWRYTGRGIVTEATRQIVSLALQAPPIERVEIRHDRANTASGGIPMRLGFLHRRDVAKQIEAPGECGVTSIWEMTKDRWPSDLTADGDPR
jgi:ribosomal-protein-serine acetyltransferase